MSAQWVDTIMSQAMAANDPNLKVAKRYLDAQVKEMESNLVLTKATTIMDIAVLLKQATDQSTDPANDQVIKAYEKLLSQVTA